MARIIPDHILNDPVTKHAHGNPVRLYTGETVGEALKRVQKSRVEGRIVYFYVVDAEDRLQGVIPTRGLLLNPPETSIAEIMVQPVITIPETASILEACEFFMLHRLLALPVVDEDRRIVGVIDVELYTDELSDLIRHEENEDVFQLIGVRLTQVRKASVPAAFRARFPWLLCNVAGGLACAALAAAFQHVLEQAVILAMFIPVVLALAESVSVQSLTLAVQMHDMGKFQWSALPRVVRREAMIGALLGLVCGGLVGVFALAWHRVFIVGMVILVSIALAVATAGVFGLFVPFALRAIKRDPKVASGPIALAMTDIATLFYYLGLATMLLE
jgi:magnesium transporter